ncbi:MAG TPA: mechanosensitive ion channel family protein [SAR202 cluster bacterium]|nr:mechanosensitive ion channel family protein [SAR202 cluster bacterium]
MPETVRDSALWGPLLSVGILAAFMLVAAVVQVMFVVAIRHRERSDTESLDLQMLKTVKGPAVLFAVLLGLFLSSLWLTRLTHPAFEFFHDQNDIVRKAWLLVVIVEVSYLASHLLQTLMSWYLHNIAVHTSTDLDAKLLPAVKRVTPLAIYAVASLLALDASGIAITPLLAGLGIGGLAIALAVQPTLSNFFAGTYLITEGELNEGDFIELDKGPSGYVVEVGWRSTKIRNRFNNLVIVPNSKMVDSIVTNFFSPNPSMNVLVTCGVSYDSDLVKVEEMVLEIANAMVIESEYADKQGEPFFGFSEFGDSNIEFFLFMQATDRTGTFIIASELIKRIHQRFRDEGIEINYPVRKIVAPPTNGARPRGSNPIVVDESPGV